MKSGKKGHVQYGVRSMLCVMMIDDVSPFELKSRPPGACVPSVLTNYKLNLDCHVQYKYIGILQIGSLRTLYFSENCSAMQNPFRLLNYRKVF